MSFTFPRASLVSLTTRFICLLLSFIILPLPSSIASVAADSFASTSAEPQPASEAYQAAEILGIRAQVDQLLRLQREENSASSRNEILSLRALVLRKILLGFLQVRRAGNKTDVELSYAYDVMYREQHKDAALYQRLNLLNFAQLSVLYTLEPRSRIHKQFTQSSVMSSTSSGVGTAIPITSVLYGKYHKLRHLAPPKYLTDVLDGGPVDTSGLPDLVVRFLDYPEPGGTKSRKEEMFADWKKNYKVDPANKNSLGVINDGKAKSPFVLNTRIMLLWSLRNHIQDFDHELMALSKLVKAPVPSSADSNLAPSGLSHGATEAAHLLRMEAQVAELIKLNQSNIQNERRLELEIFVLQKLLYGTLDVRIATDKVDQELHYSYDIVLAQLLADRGKALQRTFEMNFIQNGAIGSVAALSFLKGYPKAGNELFAISGGIGTGLSTLALLQTHGGRKEIVVSPNSLADFLNLQPSEYHFSSLMSEFLNSPSSESTEGKSRREVLYEIWKRDRVSTMNLESKKNRQKLAGMPAAKYDTIKILSNRVALLQSLKANLEFFDADLFELVQATDIDDTNTISANNVQIPTLGIPAAQAAKLLGVAAATEKIISTKHNNNAATADPAILKDELSLCRRVMSAMLEVRVTADKLDLEISKETHMRDRMARSRELGIAVTNNANFFQLGILGMISNPLSLSSFKIYNYESNVVNVVSGLLVGGLAAAAFLQRNGGYRPEKAQPNMLAQILGLNSAADTQFSPLIWNFLNSPSPILNTGITRRERLLEYWKKAKVVSLNPSNHAVAEKVAATGAAHHWWNETIKLINNRLNMLYAVRATVDLFDIGLSELLLAID